MVLNRDSVSRNKIILSDFVRGQGREQEADKILIAEAGRAAERLAEIDPTKPQEPRPDDRLGYSKVYWDYMLLGQAASRLMDTEADRAAIWLELLRPLRPQGVSRAAISAVFERSGLLRLNDGDSAGAIALWEEGLTLGDPNSLELLARLALIRVRQGNKDQKSAAIERFEQGIESALTNFRSLPQGESSSEKQAEIRRRIAVARWQLRRLTAYLLLEDGQKMSAIELLQDALIDSSEVNADLRVEVAEYLANLLISEGAWDRAAAVLNRGVYFQPDNHELRAQAAEAYLRSGNYRQAIEHWRIAGTSSSLVAQLAGAQAMFENELRRDPTQRDFDAVRATVMRIRSNLPTLDPASENLTAESPRFRARLELLEAELPGVGTAPETHFASPDFADRVEEIAGAYTSDEVVQSYAARRLAMLGRDEAARKALDRLKVLEGLPAQRLAALTQAQLLARAGDPGAAADQLLLSAQQHPDLAASILPEAANFALVANDYELAYRAYDAIPDDQRTLVSLFRMTGISAELPADSALLQLDGKKLSAAELSAFWEKRLLDREGADGTYWRFLKATRLIDELRASDQDIELNDARYLDAKRLVRDILLRRPDWGEAISLDGFLLAMAGRGNEAIPQLRRGIAAGDTRPQTRFALWDQLTRAGRFDEADQEVRSSAYGSSFALGDLTTARVFIAQQKGDYEAGLELGTIGDHTGTE